MKIKECMCNKVFSVQPEVQVTEVAKMMEQNHVGCIPVCDEEKYLSGIITDRDIVLRTIACGKNPDKTKASEIMTTKVWSCMQEEDISEAERMMSQHKIRRLPVCDQDNKLIGMLTIGNIAQKNSKSNETNIGNTMEKICDCDTNINAE